MRRSTHPLQLLSPPYRRLVPVPDLAAPLSGVEDPRGTALVWTMDAPPRGDVFENVRCRPGGIPLLVILPPAEEMDRPDDVLRVVEQGRPHSVLPFHPDPAPADLRSILSRSPENLAVEIGDYLTWRGFDLDQDTRRIIRRIVELSSELRTVSALARSLYLSRRALGRRFMQRGLPVPSHWLQMSRLLRAAIRLQSGEENVFVVAAGLGYPDGFALSNQMKRLIGVRPTRARERLGWEWLLESWLRKEAREGGFSNEWKDAFPADLHPPGEGRDDEDARSEGPRQATGSGWARRARSRS
ncbi:MAG: AraC family transcriptional regulator [Gemmatimonadota bacterium]|jgi:AraC-like DNA-binding protein